MINNKNSDICYLYNYRIYRFLKYYENDKSISYNCKKLDLSYTFMEFLIKKFERLNIITSIYKIKTSKYIKFHKINHKLLLGLYNDLYEIENEAII